MGGKRIFVVMALGVAACGGTEAGSSGQGPDGSPTSSLDVLLVQGPDFLSNSVEICGVRVDAGGAPSPGDAEYPCLSEICRCFDLSSAGELLDAGGASPGAPGLLEDLCPSENLPEAKWSFTYAIYSQPECCGDVLNGEGNPHNLVCYDSTDLVDRARPNASLECLEPGENQNEVVCITRNSSKAWDFDVCVDESTDEDVACGLFRLDCGCEPSALGDECECQQGLGPLAAECELSLADGCQLVCRTAQ